MVGPRNICGCKCHQIEPVTLKRIDISDGTTIWNYGPGTYWRHHYGLSAISGLVPDVAATSLDRYILTDAGFSSTGSTSGNSPDRSAATLAANSVTPVILTKLDSADGTVTESATVDGLFCDQPIDPDNPYFSIKNWRILGATGLSGGDYVIQGAVFPTIEFLNFTSNTTSKSYVLHAHTNRAGSIYLRTRTSNELITLDWDASNAEIDAAFEATSDCTAATVTGGPWPLKPVTVAVTWSAAGGDIKHISWERYTNIGSPTSTWVWIAGDDMWSLTSGSQCVFPSVPVAPGYSGTVDGQVGYGTCSLGGGTQRYNYGTAFSLDTGTGEMKTAVGHEFGLIVSPTPSKLIVGGANLPSYLGRADIRYPNVIIAGDSDKIITETTYPAQPASGYTVEGWTVANPWVRNWTKYHAHPILNTMVTSSNRAVVSIPNITYSGTLRCGAIINIDSGAVTSEVEGSARVSADSRYNNYWASLSLTEGSSTEINVFDYEITSGRAEFGHTYIPEPQSGHFGGGEVNIGSANEWLMGLGYHQSSGNGTAHSFGIDGDQLYANANPGDATVYYKWPSRATYGTSTYFYYSWNFNMPPHVRLASGTEWRFRFNGSSAILYTSWLDWHCSESDIETAVLAVLGENTDPGIGSNCDVYPFGSPVQASNADISLLEVGLNITFVGHNDAVGRFYNAIDPTYISRGKISVEIRTLTRYNTFGFGAWSRTDGEITWQRNFGTSIASGNIVAQPYYGWHRESALFVAGSLVEDEFA